jgi:hypothetical protein
MTKNVGQITLNCDHIAVNIYAAMARDFNLEKDFAKQLDMLHASDIAGFRNLAPKELGIVDPWRYKTYVQMSNLFKKYRFAKDLYSDGELEVKTFDAYYSNQVRLAEKQLDRRPVWLQAVLGRARSIAREILGPITEDDILDNVQFGKKASIGCPLASAYIDEKLLTREDAYTSTRIGYEWFEQKVLPKDPMLREIFGSRQPILVESLDLQLVPKAWDKLRPITPLTLIDLYRSYGIGKLAEKRLARKIRLKDRIVPGLDIRRLPARHRRWVKRHSLLMKLATADLSAASDSLVRWLLNAVLPRAWYRAVRSTFFKSMKFGERTFHAMSVLPMGNACTFPIETVVFYSLVRAVQELVGNKGIISVFGDDLIYPTKLHGSIVRVFSALGLVLNKDKTYANYPFRESCGEDYYRGVAVRPAQLRESPKRNLSGNALHSHIYKWVNVLLRRWSYKQIRGTIDMLLQLINTTGGDILRVPPQFPDQSGLKVEHPSLRLTAWAKYAPTKIRFLHGSRMYDYSYLTLTYGRRWVKAQLPYYWLALSGGSDAATHEWTKKWTHWLQEPPSETFAWLKIKRKPLRLPNGNLKKRKPRDQPTVGSRILKDVVLKQSIQDEKTPFVAAFSDWTAGLLDCLE